MEKNKNTASVCRDMGSKILIVLCLVLLIGSVSAMKSVYGDLTVMGDGYYYGNLSTEDLVVRSGQSIRLAGATFENEGTYTSVDTDFGVHEDTEPTAFLGVFAHNDTAMVHANLILQAGPEGSASTFNLIKNSPLHPFSPNSSGITNEGSHGTFVPTTNQISWSNFVNLSKDEYGNILYLNGIQRLMMLNSSNLYLEQVGLSVNGSVGIGVTTPSSLLSVYGGDDYEYNTDTIVARFESHLEDYEWVGIGLGTFNEGTSKSAIIHYRDGAYGIGDLIFASNYDWDDLDVTDADARLTIQALTGNVGIGTSSPAEALVVSSNSDTTIRIDADNGNDSTLRFFQGGGTKGLIGYDDSADLVRIGYATSLASADAILIDSDDNVQMYNELTVGEYATTAGKITILDNGSKTEPPEIYSNDDGALILEAHANTADIIMDIDGYTGYFIVRDQTPTSLMSIKHTTGDTWIKGNVGIGVNPATSKLQVNARVGPGLTEALRLVNTYAGDGDATGIMFAVNPSGYTKAGIFFENSNDGQGWARGDLHFALDNVPDVNDVSLDDTVMTLTREGNVGIGTTSPNSKLEININESSTNIFGDVQGVILKNIDTTDGNWFGIENQGTTFLSSGIAFINDNYSNNEGHIEIATKDDDGYDFRAMEIYASGVGIGLQTVGGQKEVSLDVGGNDIDKSGIRLRSGGNATTSNTAQILLSQAVGTSYTHNIRTRNTGDAGLGNAIDFYTWQNGQGASDLGSKFGMTINDGNVGIGTDSPTQTLDVNGSINVTGYIYSPLTDDISPVGLVLDMNFNNNSVNGNNILDSSGRNNHGTNNGAAHSSTGGFNGNGAYEFTSIGQSLSIPVDDSLKVGTSNYTIVTRIYPTNFFTTYAPILSKATSANDKEFALGLKDDGEVRLEVVRNGNGGEVITVGAGITLNNWYDIVATFDASTKTVSIYVDGVAQTTTGSIPLLPVDTTSGILIADYLYGSEIYHGTIDEVKIYNRILTNIEIESIYLRRTEGLDSFVLQRDVQVNTQGEIVGDIIFKGNTDETMKFTIDEPNSRGKFLKLVDDIWQPASMEFGTETVWVGPNVGMSTVGTNLATVSADSHMHLFPRDIFDGELSNGEIKIPNAYAFQEKVEYQSGNSSTWTGTNIEFTLYSSYHIFMNDGYYQTYTTAASEPVRYRMWKGTDDTGILTFDQTYPASEFPALTEIQLMAKGYLEFEENQTYFHKITSDADFSLRTNATSGAPWVAGDTSFVREDTLVSQSFSSGDITITNGTINAYGSNGESTNFIAGLNAAPILTTGHNLVVIGEGAGNAFTDEEDNTIVGRYAARDAFGSDATVVGFAAGDAANITGSVDIGFAAGYGDQAGNKLHIANSASWSLIEGSFADRWVNIEGTLNVLNGNVNAYGVGGDDTNFVAGKNAGGSMGALAVGNVLIGYNAGNGIISEDENVYIGWKSGEFADGSAGSVGVGKYSMFDADGVDRATAIGGYTGYESSANDGVYIGYNAGKEETTPSKFWLTNNDGPLMEGSFGDEWLHVYGDLSVEPGFFVGIGTDSPGTPLNILSSSVPQFMINYSSTESFAIQKGTTGTRFMVNDRDNIIYIQDDGDVGIGTDEPISLLTLANGDGGTGADNKTQIAFTWNNLNDYGHYIVTRHNSNPVNNAIDFYTSDGTINGVYPTNAIHGLTIENGKVGIGTDTPDARLDVAGSMKVAGTITQVGDFDITGDLEIDGDVSVINASTLSVEDGYLRVEGGSWFFISDGTDLEIEDGGSLYLHNSGNIVMHDGHFGYTGDGTFAVPVKTQTQIDATTKTKGMIFFNDDYGVFQGWDGSSLRNFYIIISLLY